MVGIGKPRTVATAEELLQKFDEYAAHCRANPVEVEKTQLFEGVVKRWTEQKRKPISILAFCQWIGVTSTTFYSWSKLDDEPYVAAQRMIRDAMHADRFEGGLVGQYHAMLVAKSMGLVDKQEVEVIGGASDAGVTIEIKPFDNVPMLVHPDENPLNPSGLTFTKAQIDAGVKLPCPTSS